MIADGGIVTFAAGNYASDAAYYPGYIEEVVAVAATNQVGVAADFSNYGAAQLCTMLLASPPPPPSSSSSS